MLLCIFYTELVVDSDVSCVLFSKPYCFRRAPSTKREQAKGNIIVNSGNNATNRADFSLPRTSPQFSSVNEHNGQVVIVGHNALLLPKTLLTFSKKWRRHSGTAAEAGMLVDYRWCGNAVRVFQCIRGNELKTGVQHFL
jgi:hypothetical protein